MIRYVWECSTIHCARSLQRDFCRQECSVRSRFNGEKGRKRGGKKEERRKRTSATPNGVILKSRSRSDQHTWLGTFESGPHFELTKSRSKFMRIFRTTELDARRAITINGIHSVGDEVVVNCRGLGRKDNSWAISGML